MCECPDEKMVKLPRSVVILLVYLFI